MDIQKGGRVCLFVLFFHLRVRVRVRVTLRLAVYRPSICLGVRPLETHDQIIFPLLNPFGISPYEYAWPFVKRTFRTYSTLLKNSCLCTTHKSFVSTGFAEQIMPILHMLCCNGCLFTWTVVSLTTSKFKPLFMSGFTLPSTANMFILMIPWKGHVPVFISPWTRSPICDRVNVFTRIL
jgi:hypothetical protein